MPPVLGYLWQHPISSTNFYISYSLLHHKPPQNVVTLNDNHLFAHNSVGQQFGLGSAGQFFYWSHLSLLICVQSDGRFARTVQSYGLIHVPGTGVG